MEIKFTKEQYENLLKMIYLGNWMINAIRSGAKEDPQIEKYNEIEQHIFSFAEAAGLENYIEYDKKCSQFFPTWEFGDNPELEKYREDYDDDVFWHELPDRLGVRDFYRQYTEKEINKMSQKERFIKKQDFIIKYEEEFDENGIKNLEIIKK